MALENFNKSIIDEFRANGGKVGGQFSRAPLLLLTTIGAKSGQSRINPLAYVADGNRYIIAASYAGGPTNPPWYYNLVANSRVTVEVGTDSFVGDATILDEPERTQLYDKMVDAMPTFAEYRSKTKRTIPVIALSRA